MYARAGLVPILSVFLFFLLAPPAGASLTGVYIAQTLKGADTGLDCADAHAASFFNSAGNWGTGAAQIGNDTIVHLCGTFIGGNATTFLTFQGSGAAGHPVTLLFETGAALKPDYCAEAGCIDLNGQSYIAVDGGVTCGETSHWSTTPCNGLIQNQRAGTTGQMCPGGACSPLSSSTFSMGIGTSAGNPTNIEIRNLKIQLYVRAPSGDDANTDGMGTWAIGARNGRRPQGIVVHNMIFTGVRSGFMISLGSVAGTLADYEVYNSNFTDQCWAMGVGANNSDMIVNTLTFHDNEVSNWDAWARANPGDNACHTNGTMWFNGNGTTVFAADKGICVSGSPCLIYNNYLHGDLTGAYATASASGLISCQDNCQGNTYIFNNIVVDECANTAPVRACGGPIYLNGAGGGGQHIYNNTIVASHGSNCFLITSQTAPAVITNNICTGEANNIAVNQSGTAWSSFYVGDYNVIYGLTNQNNWVCNRSAHCGTQADAASNDVGSVTTNPNLDPTFRLLAGSAALGLGANLTSVGIAALNADPTGAARPSSGRWDAGAYQWALVPRPPNYLQVTVH